MFAPGNITRSPELPDAGNGDYVPVYVFESGTGFYLPPTRKVVEFLISCLEGKVKRDELPSEEYLQEREVGDFIEQMDDHPNWFQTRPGDTRNAIFFKGIVDPDLALEVKPEIARKMQSPAEQESLKLEAEEESKE